MKIIADSNIPAVRKAFATIGKVELAEGRSLSAASITDADILLVRSVTQVNAELLEGSNVRFVGSATSGRDHIDEQYLAQANIGFAHAPGCNAQSVVEYVLAAICQTGQHLERLLQGGTLGIVGYGHVGRALVQLCDALKIQCCVYDPWLEKVPYAASFESILTSDVVSLHCELTHERPWPSYHLVSAHELSRVRSGALLINASRGSVIDNSALCDRLETKADIDVVLDVWEGEPVISPQLLDQVTIGTPHIAGYSHDGKLSATYHLARQAIQYFTVNAEVASDSSAALPVIELAQDCDRVTALRALIGARYIIGEDDASLRAVAQREAPSIPAKGFDELRKHYPQRRELRGSSVRYAGADETLLSDITALGCTLHAGCTLQEVSSE